MFRGTGQPYVVIIDESQKMLCDKEPADELLEALRAIEQGGKKKFPRYGIPSSLSPARFLRELSWFCVRFKAGLCFGLYQLLGLSCHAPSGFKLEKAQQFPNPHFSREEFTTLFDQYAEESKSTPDKGILADIWSKTHG